MAAEGEILVLVLSNGMQFSELAAVIDGLKNSSKSMGSHARREKYWQAYTKMNSKVAGMDGQAYCMLMYRAKEDGEGECSLMELTKRQKGLVNGACEFMGQKVKPPEDPSSKNWCLVFSEEDAPRAWRDLMEAEPCICIAPDGVYVSTLHKRVLCKALSGPIKSLKDLEALIAELAPEKPLRSISFTGNEPPSVNSYNTFVVGPSQLGPQLPPTIGHVASTSTHEIYAYFLKRKSAHTVGEADKLIAQMLTDVSKGETAIVLTGKKEAQIAVKNSLMKRVFVHESMGKFIDFVRNDGSIEMIVVSGPLEELGKFGEFGGLVFELFYRADLSAFG
eukprot:CAMPEP_0177696976 /NCGR_PEP_ID=MMETSP0484_2-20121128/4266_1 /TAXON_ID=354590 /ORGANISM="Rhodomonas lens, Strain RHODO" /LENGTH=333 /DNA_ID=CAMNT_0019207981 /DNA_START=37 /DNA_END=1038 /DNA_ORIENTATION=+